MVSTWNWELSKFSSIEKYTSLKEWTGNIDKDLTKGHGLKTCRVIEVIYLKYISSTFL